MFLANCEIPLPCASKPCIHGDCINSPDQSSFTCQCYQGYEGDVCNQRMSSCDETTCIHGNCVSEADSTDCVCENGYKGCCCITG